MNGVEQKDGQENRTLEAISRVIILGIRVAFEHAVSRCFLRSFFSNFELCLICVALAFCLEGD